MSLEKLSQTQDKPNNPLSSEKLDKSVFNQIKTQEESAKTKEEKRKKREKEKKEEKREKETKEKETLLLSKDRKELQEKYIELVKTLFTQIEREQNYQETEKELDFLVKLTQYHNIPHDAALNEIIETCSKILSTSYPPEKTTPLVFRLAKKYNLPLEQIINQSIKQTIYEYDPVHLFFLLNKCTEFLAPDCLNNFKTVIYESIIELLRERIPQSSQYDIYDRDIYQRIKQIFRVPKDLNIDINFSDNRFYTAALEGLIKILKTNPHLLPEFINFCNEIGISLQITDPQIIKTIKEVKPGKNGLIKLLDTHQIDDKTLVYRIPAFINFCHQNKIHLNLNDPDIIAAAQNVTVETLNNKTDIKHLADLHSVLQHIPVELHSPEIIEAMQNKVAMITKDNNPDQIFDFLKFLSGIPPKSFDSEITKIAQRVIIRALSTFDIQYWSVLDIIDKIPIDLSTQEINMAVQEGLAKSFIKESGRWNLDFLNFIKRHHLIVNFADPQIIAAIQTRLMTFLEDPFSSNDTLHNLLKFIREQNIPIDIQSLKIKDVIKENFEEVIAYGHAHSFFTKLTILKNYFPVLEQEIANAILDRYKNIVFRNWNYFINTFYSLKEVDSLVPDINKLFLIFIVRTRHVQPKITDVGIESIFPAMRTHLKEFLNKYLDFQNINPHLLKKIYEKIPLASNDIISQLREDAIALNDLDRKFTLIRDIIHNEPGKINLGLIQRINAFIDKDTSDDKILKELYQELETFWEQKFSFINDKFYSFEFLKELKKNPEAKRILHKLQSDLERLWKNDVDLEEKIKKQYNYLDNDAKLKTNINYLLELLHHKRHNEIAIKIGRIRMDISLYLKKCNKDKAEIYILDRYLEQLSYTAYAEYLNHPQEHNFTDHIKVLESILLSMKADNFYNYNASINELLNQIHNNYLTSDTKDASKWKNWINKLYSELSNILLKLRQDFESLLQETNLQLSLAEKEQIFSEFFRNRSPQFLDKILKQIDSLSKKNKENLPKQYSKDSSKKLNEKITDRLLEKYFYREGD